MEPVEARIFKVILINTKFRMTDMDEDVINKCISW
jgi:hypothetical protein